MLYCPDIKLLFCHFPKTGGQSIDDFLCSKFKSVRMEHTGGKHDSIRNAVELCKRRSIEFDNFRVITGMRHPHDVVISLYFHWKKTSPERMKKFNDVQSFVRYYITSSAHSNEWIYKNHLLVNGILLSNVHIVKFEPSLIQNLANIFRNIDIDVDLSDFPHKHKTEHLPYIKYYTSQELINLVTNKFKWVFDQGYYEIPKLGV